MNESGLVKSMTNKMPSKTKEMLLNLLATMTPERFTEHMNNTREMAV